MQSLTKRSFIFRPAAIGAGAMFLGSASGLASIVAGNRKLRGNAKVENVKARPALKRRLDTFQITTVSNAFRMANAKTEIDFSN